MARDTVPFAEEECCPSGCVTWNGAFDRGSGKGMDISHQLLQFLIGELKTGHSRGRDTFADHFAQSLDCSSAGIIGRDNVRSSLSAFSIGTVTGGAVRRKVTSPCLNCLRVRLRALRYRPRPPGHTPDTAQQEEQKDEQFFYFRCAWHSLRMMNAR